MTACLVPIYSRIMSKKGLDIYLFFSDTRISAGWWIYESVWLRQLFVAYTVPSHYMCHWCFFLSFESYQQISANQITNLYFSISFSKCGIEIGSKMYLASFCELMTKTKIREIKYICSLLYTKLINCVIGHPCLVLLWTNHILWLFVACLWSHIGVEQNGISSAWKG